MTDLNDQGGAEGVEEAPVAPQQTEAEKQARDLGWTPEEDWDGPPDSWLPHDEFLRKEGRTATKLKRATERTKQLESEVGEVTTRLERMERLNNDALKRQREQLERQYEARIEELTERGDVKGVKQALKEQKADLEQLEDKAEEKLAGNGQPRLSKPDQEAVEGFFEENKAWFHPETGDKVLNRVMNAHFEVLREEMPAASMEDILIEAKRRTAADYPKKFGKSGDGGSANGVNRVESGGRNLNGSGERGYWAKVPAGDKARAERDMKAYPTMYKTKEDWARVYFDVKEDE